jgi:hypothetical protein
MPKRYTLEQLCELAAEKVRASTAGFPSTRWPLPRLTRTQPCRTQLEAGGYDAVTQMPGSQRPVNGPTTSPIREVSTAITPMP